MWAHMLVAVPCSEHFGRVAIVPNGFGGRPVSAGLLVSELTDSRPEAGTGLHVPPGNAEEAEDCPHGGLFASAVAGVPVNQQPGKAVRISSRRVGLPLSAEVWAGSSRP
jgi:hypothetical protein